MSVVTPNADGPDIAHYQRITGAPDPRWKLFSHKATEGRGGFDKDFASRWGWMHKQPTIRYRAAYHWLRTDSAIKDQVANFVGRVDAAGGFHVGDIVQTDWETTPGIAVPTSDMVIEFNDRIRQAFGRDCVITYTSDWLPDSPLDADNRAEFFEWREQRPNDALWFANYNTDAAKATGGWRECAQYRADVWQWTSSFRAPNSIVSISGGGFDMNHVFKWETLERLAGYGVETPPAPNKDQLVGGEVLTPGQMLTSQDGNTHFVYQADGNVVLYKGANALWASGTNGIKSEYLVMQSDGNLVLYAPGVVPVWSTNTSGNPGALLIVQDATAFVLGSRWRKIWTT